jgi:hypothetical protein
MHTEKVADDMVDFFAHTYRDLMPMDPFEQLRIGLFIRAKVLATVVDTTREVLIENIKQELRQRKEIAELLYEDIYRRCDD